MVDQPAHPIIVTYWEGDETKDHAFTALTYIEWTCGPRSYYAHADGSTYDPFGETEEDERIDNNGNIETRGIPLPVRRALAELIFPPINYVDLKQHDPEYEVTCPHCGSTIGVN